MTKKEQRLAVQAKIILATQPAACPGGIRVGSDFAGMMAEGWALRAAGIPHQHIFAAEIEEAPRMLMQQNFTIGTLYGDVSMRVHGLVPEVDLYCAGFPCQPFSTLGSRLGLSDIRGSLIYDVLTYITLRLPKVCVLENVKTLVSPKRRQLHELILRVLEECKYNAYHALVNTANHGIPHERTRLYYVAIRKEADNGSFMWPAPVACPGLAMFLDGDPSLEVGLPPRAPPSFRHRVVNGLVLLLEKGVNPTVTDCVIDAGSSCDFTRPATNKIMTITSSRAGQGKYWLTARSRYASVAELARLQGHNARLIRRDGITDSEFGRMVGNGMSVNVLERMLPRALAAAGLVSGVHADRWLAPGVVQQLF